MKKAMTEKKELSLTVGYIGPPGDIAGILSFFYCTVEGTGLKEQYGFSCSVSAVNKTREPFVFISPSNDAQMLFKYYPERGPWESQGGDLRPSPIVSEVIKDDSQSDKLRIIYETNKDFRPIFKVIDNHPLTQSKYKQLVNFVKKDDQAAVNAACGDILVRVLEGDGYAVTIEIILPDIYPIVKIDRATAQELFPIFIEKGIFAGSMALPTKNEILEKHQKKLGKERLTFKEEREALSAAGEYRTGRYVYRDYGEYAIGFSSYLYLDYLNRSEEELTQAWKNPSLFEDENKAIEDALKRIRLYKLGHKLAYIILAEVYKQKTYKGVVIPKLKIISHYLGYDPGEKGIYENVKEAFLSLRWLDYKLFDYSYTDTKREYKRAKGKAVGNFIYNFAETQKHYTLDVNEKFVGCVSYLWGEKIQRTRKERKTIFGSRGGYFSWITRAMPLSRDYSAPAYLLQDFLIRDSGNRHHKKGELKGVVYDGSRFIEECRITHKRANQRWPVFLNAIKEVEIIKDMTPSVSELESIKPSDGEKTKICMYITKSARALDQEIKEILQQK